MFVLGSLLAIPTSRTINIKRPTSCITPPYRTHWYNQVRATMVGFDRIFINDHETGKNILRTSYHPPEASRSHLQLVLLGFSIRSAAEFLPSGLWHGPRTLTVVTSRPKKTYRPFGSWYYNREHSTVPWLLPWLISRSVGYLYWFFAIPTIQENMFLVDNGGLLKLFAWMVVPIVDIIINDMDPWPRTTKSIGTPF